MVICQVQLVVYLFDSLAIQAFNLQNSVSLVSTREPFAQVGSTMVPDGKLDCFLMGQPQALFHLFLFSIFKKPAVVELRLSE